MDWWHLIDTSRVVVFVLVLTRVSGIVITAPVLSTTDSPMSYRALLAFALSLCIMPSQWLAEVAEPDTIPAFAVMIAAELGIGLSMGLGIYIFFAGASLAGELIGQVGGLSAAQIFDPISGDQTPLLSRAFQYLAITVFVLIGGLNVLVTSLLDTFETLPIGTLAFQPQMAYSLTVILEISFGLALRIAAPTLVAVLVTMLVMGLLGKTLPQLNLMSVGFGVNSLAMFAVFGLSLGTGIWCFQERIGDVFELLFNGLHTTIDTGMLNL
ncbi:MAG: flagellar biosynthetic protein FliR [Planctomycetaceae bacterium]|jgi:flagellar biosynthetic protein FliR|nr:flagellar biosynthetic protein FliR [Planctomycetaceae bacterium]